MAKFFSDTALLNSPPVDSLRQAIEGTSAPFEFDPKLKFGNHSRVELLDQAVQDTKAMLKDLALDPNASAKMTVAFGETWNQEIAKSLFQGWAVDDFASLPKLEIRLGSEINNADGAFASDTYTIYLSSNFLAQNAGNVESVTRVLLEEIGHAIDVRINQYDAAGDEGDIFSRLVRGESISAAELTTLKAENDHATVWLNGLATDIEMSQINMATFKGKLYQTHQGLDNKIYIRSSGSPDGSTGWSDWQAVPDSETHTAPTLAASSTHLYQSHRGTNNLIYTRSSTDGTNWSDWSVASGLTYNAPTLAVVNDRLYQSHRGSDDKIYTRYATNPEATQWSDWHDGGGETYSAPGMASFKGTLYQVHRGRDNMIYTRFATNREATTWTAWERASEDTATESAPAMVEFNGNLYQSHRGLNDRVYTRVSADGKNWSAWEAAQGDMPDGFAYTLDAPAMTVFDGKLYQTHQGLNNNIYTRYSTDGTTWSNWEKDTGLTPAEPQIIRFSESVDTRTQWHANVFLWDTWGRANPVTNFYDIDKTGVNQIATLNLGSNTRGDGKQGITFDWGTGSPKGETNRLPDDYFAVRAHTQATFDGKEYTFRVKGDDGFQLLAKKIGTNNWTYITPQSSWETVNGYKEYKVSNLNGNYDLHFHYFERQGASNFDLSWEQTGRTTGNYFSQLASLSDNDWDRQSGDDLYFDGKGNDESRSEIKQIYTDLSTTIFGSRKTMTAGYAFDPSYADYVRPRGLKPYHSAIDMGANNGTSIKAATNGVVAVVDMKSYGGVVGVDETNDKGEKTGRR
jgi:hypothetical protein